MLLHSRRLKSAILFSVVILIIGVLFKVQHWPYANLIMTIGFSVIGILYFFRFYNKKEKSFLDYVKLVLVSAWAIGGVFTILHLPYKSVFRVITSVSFIIFIILFQDAKNDRETDLEKKRDIKKWIFDAVFLLAAIGIVLGAIFKIMHWPYASVFLITGIILGVLWAIRYFLSDK